MRHDADRRRYLIAHPGSELYGSDRVMLESVLGFIAAGTDVVVTVPDDGPLVAQLRDAGAIVEIAPALVLRKSLLAPRGWMELIRSTVRGWRSAHRLLTAYRPDAVYVSTITLPLWPVAAASRRLPSVVHLHEAEQNASAVVKKGLYSPALLARGIIVNSEFSRSVLADAYPGLASRSEVVYNGVAGPAQVTAPRPNVSEPIRLVYIGRLSPRKGPDVIVDALALLPPELSGVHLDLVGAVFTGYEWYEQELREKIARHGLGDRVRLLGFRPAVWGAVDDGDIVVIPSRLDEPFGNTAVEGVLAERVVLVSDTSGLREATEGFSTAIRFAPDDAQALADAIGRAVAEWPRLQPQLHDQAQRASERFSPERYRADIVRLMDAASSR